MRGTRTIPSSYDFKAAAHLDRFKIAQPHVHTMGIWKSDEHKYFLICPDANEFTLTADGENLFTWFESRFREATFFLKILHEPPSGATKVTERTSTDVILAKGDFRNMAFVLSDLLIELPDSFPRFAFVREPQGKILLEKEISDDEFNILSNIVQRLGFHFEVTVEVNISYFEENDKKNLEKQILEEKASAELKLKKQEISSRLEQYIPLTFSRQFDASRFSDNFRKVLRSDEKFWVENRVRVLSSSEKLESIRLGDGAFPSVGMVDLRHNTPVNIVNYYSIFNHLLLVLPPGLLEKKLNQLNVNEKQICNLVAKKKITLILPYDVKKYPQALLESISDIDGNALVLPRKLAMLLVDDSKKNFPLLYPPISIDQMKFILAKITEESRSSSDPKQAIVLKNIVKELGNCWLSTSVEIPYKATDSNGFFGMGRLFTSLWGIEDEITKFHLSSLLLSVQVASAFSAIQIPDEKNEMIVSAGSSIFSGIQSKEIPKIQSKLDVIIEGLFTVADNIPVDDFVDAFQGSDINRLRKFVTEIASGSATIEDAAEIAKRYNNEAKKFTKKLEFMQKLDLLGLLISLAAYKFEVTAFVPPTTWINEGLRYLFRGDSSGFGSSILDVVDGFCKTSDPRAVLVARMKNDISKKL